jgi:RimJ/RimL family protein N-acetyltransferase
MRRMRRNCSVVERTIVTDRLLLRHWCDRDVKKLHRFSSDLRVMEFLGPPQSIDDVRRVVNRQRNYQAQLGYCFWAIELRTTRQMIGFCGLQPGPLGTPLAGLIEIGWRLDHDHWGKGYAREAALASLNWGFAHLSIDIIWSITVPANLRSWGLMERIGMTRHFDLDFDHPTVPDDSPLKRHVTYGITRDEWGVRRGGGGQSGGRLW